MTRAEAVMAGEVQPAHGIRCSLQSEAYTPQPLAFSRSAFTVDVARPLQPGLKLSRPETR
jgi:hypothetical protein